MYGVTVLLIDATASRTRLLRTLRRLGLRALAVDRTEDALSLLEALDADVSLVRNDDDDTAIAALRARLPVVKLDRAAGVEEAVVALLRALGRPDEAAQIN
jgi:hypothetical protein